MHRQVLGLIVIIGAPVVLLVCYYLGFVSNLSVASEKIIIGIVTAMIVGGVSLIWRGQEADEKDNRRREDIWKAIGEWVSQPSYDYSPGVGRVYEFPLAREPPNLSVEIEDCLRKNYSSIWNDIEELRRKYAARQAPGAKVGMGTAIKDALDGLVGLESRIRQELKSEILDKHYTQLKC
jgi:hypothetical protein